MTNDEHQELVEIYEGDPWHVRMRLKKFIDTAVITVDTPVTEEPKAEAAQSV